MTNDRSVHRPVVLMLVLVCLLPGCILIRTTEHRVSVNPDGSGEAVLRLIDLRSDQPTDSLVAQDYDMMRAAFENDAPRIFAQRGRMISEKKLYVRDDTLVAEVAYTFRMLDAIEGLHVTEDELYVVVNENREVTRTNGTVVTAKEGGQRIVWKRDAQRLLFQIREKTFPVARSLATLHLQRSR